MEVIAFMIAAFVFAKAVGNESKIKVLERQLSFLKQHLQLTDIDLLSPETKGMVGQLPRSEIIKAIRKEVSVTREEAEALIDEMEKGEG